MKKARVKKKAAKKEPAAAPSAPEDKDDKFDFGGIPPRDLKKNLGCG